MVYLFSMAQKPDPNLKSLAEAYTQFVEAPEGDVQPDSGLLEGDDNRYLRSGSTHPRVNTNPSPNSSSRPAPNN